MDRARGGSDPRVGGRHEERAIGIAPYAKGPLGWPHGHEAGLAEAVTNVRKTPRPFYLGSSTGPGRDARGRSIRGSTLNADLAIANDVATGDPSGFVPKLEPVPPQPTASPDPPDPG